MGDLHTAPAEAYAPDPDRTGPDSSTPLPEWLVHFLALLILFLLEHFLSARRRRAARLTSCRVERPELPAGSTQALAAPIRGPFSHAIALMCRHRGIGPGHQDRPELSRAIVAFGGSLRGLHGRQYPQPWWETSAIVPGMIGAETGAPASLAVLLSQPALAVSPPPAPKAAPARALHAVAPASCRQVFARFGTGPPTGPPAVSGQQSSYA